MTVEVMLGIFSLERNPLLQGNCIATMCYGEYCIIREEIVRETRGSYNKCVVGCIPYFCWIIKRKDLEISPVDIAHTQ
jgi:hypothetical protein